MASVAFDRVRKEYDGVVAIRTLNLDIAEGEFVTLVGASGCGKSTALRMVAGLEDITAGAIRIGGRAVNDLPPRLRNVSMVFQNYALYPHMSVYANIAFGLKIAKVDRSEIDRRVREVAQLLSIEEFLNRRPAQLSGGQRQRVAMGRAIVRNPDVFLFDEPLSNLDAQLRIDMRREIRRLHDRLGVTSIYVTHDQTEAMTLPDRIAILKHGDLQQFASPVEVYETPANLFVAGFIGSPSMNFLDAQIRDAPDRSLLRIGELTIPLTDEQRGLVQASGGHGIVVGIRPEHVCYGPGGSDDPERAVYRDMAEIVTIEHTGSDCLVDVTMKGTLLRAKIDPRQHVAVGDIVPLEIDRTAFHFFDASTEVNLRQVS